MDAQKSFSEREMALEVLRGMKGILTALKGLQELEQSPEKRAEFNRYKYQFKRLSETKMFGMKLLASDLSLSQSNSSYVYFKIPGFDMRRERYQDEIVTIVIADKLVTVPFNTMFGMMEQRREIVSTFGRQLFDVEINLQDEIFIGIDDESWCQWDRVAAISGWGFRFAKELPVSIPVTPRLPVVQQITSLVHKSPEVIEQIERFEGLVEQRVSEYSDLVKEHVEGVQFLTKMVGPLPSKVGSLKSEFLSNPRQALSMVSYAFNGPTRDNVIKLVSSL
ncbi:hypothetical protein [Vibrio owensii]|uniref:hypothetical protein n=1 Tax=Vibrio owensii TaxID=696485 RepID=UPI001A7EFDD7|nr:hypothetical protein [Vibrio owensii]